MTHAAHDSAQHSILDGSSHETTRLPTAWPTSVATRSGRTSDSNQDALTQWPRGARGAEATRPHGMQKRPTAAHWFRSPTAIHALHPGSPQPAMRCSLLAARCSLLAARFLPLHYISSLSDTRWPISRPTAAVVTTSPNGSMAQPPATLFTRVAPALGDVSPSAHYLPLSNS